LIAPSPDGSREAVVWHRDCGATTGITTLVTIRLAGDGRERADGVESIASFEGAPDVLLNWRGDRSIVVSSDGYPVVTLPEYDGVTVETAHTR
jgi:hypothetical protein